MALSPTRTAWSGIRHSFVGHSHIAGSPVGLALTKRHLGNEEAAYSTIAALVDPRLVAALEADHATIDEALRELSSADADPARRQKARDHLAQAVVEHIQLEETALFPAALAALGRQ